MEYLASVSSNSSLYLTDLVENMNSAQTEEILANTVVSVIDTTENGDEKWSEVQYYNMSGWIKSDDLIKLDQKDSFPYQLNSTVYVSCEPNEKVSVYKDELDQSEIVDELDYGKEIKLINVDKQWAQVSFDDLVGWVKVKNIAPYIEGNYFVNLENDGDTLYIRNSAEGDIIGYVPNNTLISVGKFQKGWGEINYNGISGWVNMHYMTACSKDYTVPVETTNVQNSNSVSESTSSTGNGVNNSTPSYTEPVEPSYTDGSSDTDNSQDSDENLDWNYDELTWE